jgi:hypothetical protein
LRSLEKVLELRDQKRILSDRVADMEKAGPKRMVRTASYVSLFLMMDFAEEYKAVEDAIRAVFEDEPYCFQVILARDRTIHTDLFENVKAHMRMVDGFIAEISDLNPNVMLELGITEVDPENRPVVVLRRTESKKPPADLRSRLYVEYEGGSEALAIAAELKKKFETIEAIDRLKNARRGRYLSATWVRNNLTRITLSPDETRKLCRASSTVEELQKAGAGEIASKAGLDRQSARLIESLLKDG